MYRSFWTTRRRGRQSPHKRGDVPFSSADMFAHCQISPQAWGCTVLYEIWREHLLNLPTSVGMYRRLCLFALPGRKSPHKRGDVPFYHISDWLCDRISPQAWGCTGPTENYRQMGRNLPTSVGMYRSEHGLFLGMLKSPHKRGDVPTLNHDALVQSQISPQAWGCTALQGHSTLRRENLPTGVGMYRGFYRASAFA